MTVLTRSLRFAESEVIAYRRTWRGTVISSFINPIFFLSAMGAGLGQLVDSGGVDLGVPYLAFVATGLMAANAMQSGAGDASFPVMAGVEWRKNFHATITTPLGPQDIILGRFAWGTVRLTFILLVFSLIAVGFGAMELGPALLAIPAAVLTGLAFIGVITAFTLTQKDSTGLTAMFRFGIMPLFLFSGTFFPISQLPSFLQKVAYATPLFHGVELVRKIALPGADPSIVTSIPVWVHVTYLLVMLVVGTYFAVRILNKRLRP